MAGVYSRSFYQLQNILETATVQNEDEGTIWVIRDVCLWFSEDAVAAKCSVTGFADNTFAWASYSDLLASGPTQAYHWEGRVVIPYLGSFAVVPDNSGPGSIDVTVCGYELSA